MLVGFLAGQFHAAADTILPGSYLYDNLAAAQTGGDRLASAGRGLAQSFVAGATDPVLKAVFGLTNLSSATGELDAALYQVTGSSSPYGIGTRVGSIAVFDTSLVSGSGYTTIDVSGLGWNVVGGQDYAVALWAGSNFSNNAASGVGGVYWVGGSFGAGTLDHFNNWNVPSSSWEDWGGGAGFSLGLTTVPELDPAGMTGVLALLGSAIGLLERRRSATR